MEIIKTATPFKDKFGKTIYENDFCRYWIADECETITKGHWIIESVRMYKGDWHLFTINFDYANSEDEPVLLSKHCQTIEVITND